MFSPSHSVKLTCIVSNIALQLEDVLSLFRLVWSYIVMSAALAIEYPRANGTVLTGTLPNRVLQLAPRTSLKIGFPDFDCLFEAPLICVTPVDSDIGVVKAAIDANITATLNLKGNFIKGETEFLPEQVSVKLDREAEGPVWSL
jgi:hypothetical protein